MGRTCPDVSGQTSPWQTISKYHVTAPFRMQEMKLKKCYIKTLSFHNDHNEFKSELWHILRKIKNVVTMENLLVIQENAFSFTKSMHPSKKMQPLYTRVNKLVASDVQICFPYAALVYSCKQTRRKWCPICFPCFPYPYLKLHAKYMYSHMLNMPWGGTSPPPPPRSPLLCALLYILYPLLNTL